MKSSTHLPRHLRQRELSSDNKKDWTNFISINCHGTALFTVDLSEANKGKQSKRKAYRTLSFVLKLYNFKNSFSNHLTQKNQKNTTYFLAYVYEYGVHIMDCLFTYVFPVLIASLMVELKVCSFEFLRYKLKHWNNISLRFR